MNLDDAGLVLQLAALGVIVGCVIARCWLDVALCAALIADRDRDPEHDEPGRRNCRPITARNAADSPRKRL